jgi:hypothetical protein
LTETWKYALLGGIASVPFTVGLFWLSGTGSEFALDVVLLGGLLAGYLARAGSADASSTSVGVRAGVVGGLPGLWLLVDVLRAASALAGPVWFQVAAVSMTVVVVTTAVLGFAGVVGVLGAKVGDWLAEKRGVQRSALPEN